MDVIYKEGLLFLQGVKFGKKTWRKIWMVLYKPSSTGVGRLELYTAFDKNSGTGRQRTPGGKSVRLRDCLSVTPAPDESCPKGCTAFYLNTTQCTYTLASTTSQEWRRALCLLAFQNDPGESEKGDLKRGNSLAMENNDLYSSWKTNPTVQPNRYSVMVQSTEASRRCSLAGEYLLSPEEEAVTLLDYNTGQIIYSWPYRLLRKFGQTEGGFSIEAGRRCQSGEGMFVFLSPHSPEIFQVLVEQCSVERSPSAKAFNLSERRSSDQCACTFPPTPPPVCTPPYDAADTQDNSAVHYSTINYASALKLDLSSSREDVGDEGEDEQCYSLGSVSLDGDVDDNIYYNWRRSASPLIRQDPDTDESESVYSDIKETDSSSNSQPQPFSSALQPHACPLALPALSALQLTPKYQRHPAVSNVSQAGFNTQAYEADGRKETEEAISSSAHVTPTETPGSFRYRLAELFSKDLAKIQPPLPPGVGGPSFSH